MYNALQIVSTNTPLVIFDMLFEKCTAETNMQHNVVIRFLFKLDYTTLINRRLSVVNYTKEKHKIETHPSMSTCGS